ncbi:hypothetical protein [Paenibacillus periandrae]|uniref:hypothetical protein n=1 Tax=Paenibacillus periandrae TaxID=1761741 RepID=UPI001F095424|nr:hypothetical protein [Paenibacillus periandrae]
MLIWNRRGIQAAMKLTREHDRGCCLLSYRYYHYYIEALEYYADWLLFLGKVVEFERIPDELRLILEERFKGKC